MIKATNNELDVSIFACQCAFTRAGPTYNIRNDSLSKLQVIQSKHVAKPKTAQPGGDRPKPRSDPAPVLSTCRIRFVAHGMYQTTRQQTNCRHPALLQTMYFVLHSILIVGSSSDPIAFLCVPIQSAQNLAIFLLSSQTARPGEALLEELLGEKRPQFAPQQHLSQVWLEGAFARWHFTIHCRTVALPLCGV